MDLVTYPNEILRLQASDVSFFDDFLEAIVNRMIDFMNSYSCVGISAPQIGISRRIVVIDTSGRKDRSNALVLINPRIVAAEGEQSSEEECLSIPDTTGKVLRSAVIDVEFQTLTGEQKQLKAEGFNAAIIQHEIDHLFGVLFIDRAFEISSFKPVGKTL